MAYYWLTPPSRAVFFLSVLLAVLAASRALCPHRHSGGESLYFRDVVVGVLAALSWQPVQRLLASGFSSDPPKLARLVVGYTPSTAEEIR